MAETSEEESRQARAVLAADPFMLAWKGIVKVQRKLILRLKGEFERGT
jgi:hypothetical protein